MGIRIMHKPYHVVAYDNDKEVWRATVQPPPLAGLNKDNKSPKNDKGQWIRVFSVSDSGNSPMAVGDDIVTYQTVGEFPEGKHEDLRVRIELIPGLRAKKQRRAAANKDTSLPSGLKLKSIDDAAAEATEDDKNAAIADAVEHSTSDEHLTAADIES
jgi:hypothetical protein